MRYAMTMLNGMKSPEDIIFGIAGTTTTGFWDWAGLCGIALSVSAVLLAFIYVWATLFRNIQLISYVKQELYELAISGILVVLLFSAVGAMGNITLGTFLPDDMIPRGVSADANIYNASAMYYEQVDKDMSGWLELNYILNIYVDQTASVTPYARPLGVGLVASPMTGFAAPLKQLFYNMSVALSMAFIINQAQLVIYIFSLNAFLNFYLPLGMFLRCFMPTRALGGTLIGVAVSFLFVFPVLSVAAYGMFYGAGGGPLVTFNTMIASYFGDVRSDIYATFDNFFSKNYASATTDSEGNSIDLVSGALGGIGIIFQSVIGGSFITLMMFPISIISWAFALGFIIPAFNALIFTQAAKQLSKTFGEEVDISSLTRMI